MKGPDPRALLKPYAAELMTMWPVSPKFNSPKNDSPELLDEVDEPEAEGERVERANEGEADREPTNSE